MSELKKMLKRHYDEKQELLNSCNHPPDMIKIYEDHSVVGRGCGIPSVHVICKNCGFEKIIFRDFSESNIEVQKTLEFQHGFKHQRFSQITYEWELD